MLEGASLEEAAKIAGMDRQTLREGDPVQRAGSGRAHQYSFSGDGAHGPKGDPGPSPPFRVVTGTDAARCADDEILVSLVCASGATDGAKCATPGTAATALCVRK